MRYTLRDTAGADRRQYIMDNIVSIIIQGIIQGLTEFLPVSSSGHLSVAQHFMNVEDGSMVLFSCIIALNISVYIQ